MNAALGFKGITVDIPMDATLEQVEDSLRLAVNGYKRLAEASERLKPIIGRILLTVQERKLYKTHYNNFTAFLMDRVVAGMGLGRSNAFDALRIAKAFPSLSNEEYMRIGASRLLIAAKVTDETEANYKDVLKEATTLTVEEWNARAKEIKGTGPKASYTISVRVSPEIKAEWTELIGSVDITPPELFEQMLHLLKENLSKYTARKPVTPSTEIVNKVRHAMKAS